MISSHSKDQKTVLQELKIDGKYVIGDNNTCFQKIPNCKTQINGICNTCQGKLTLKTNKCVVEKNID